MCLDYKLDPPEDCRPVVALCYLCGEEICDNDEEYVFEFSKIGDIHLCQDCIQNAKQTAVRD